MCYFAVVMLKVWILDWVLLLLLLNFGLVIFAVVRMCVCVCVFFFFVFGTKFSYKISFNIRLQPYSIR